MALFDNQPKGGTTLSDLMSTANSKWDGTFGTDSFKPAAIATAEQRATKNAPLNDTQQTPWVTSNKTDFQFSATPLPELSREANFRENEREATLAGQRAQQQQQSGAEQLGRTASQNYQDKVNIDQNAKAQDFNNQLSLLNRQGGFSSPSQISNDASIFGMIAQNPRRTALTSTGLNDIGIDFSRLAENNVVNANNATNLAAYSRANQSGNIARDRSQADIQSQQMANESLYNNARDAFNFANQAKEAARQRSSNEQIARTQASANIYGSMFGALNSPGANYRYWS